MPPSSNRTIGLVLAGGQAKRFGKNKSLALLNKEPLIGWTLKGLRKVCQEVWLSVGQKGMENPYRFLSWDKIFYDEVPQSGPLTALLGPLKETADQDLLLVCACDQPLLAVNLLKYLIQVALKSPEPAVVCVDDQGKILPFPGIYRRLLIKGWSSKRALHGSMRNFLKGKGARFITPREWRKFDPQGLSFFNINYPKDLEKAKGLLTITGNQPL